MGRNRVLAQWLLCIKANLEIRNYKKSKGGKKMEEHKKRFVWVNDKAGNEYVCRIDDLKDPKKVDEEDLKNCVDDGSRAINIGD